MRHLKRKVAAVNRRLQEEGQESPLDGVNQLKEESSLIKEEDIKTKREDEPIRRESLKEEDNYSPESNFKTSTGNKRGEKVRTRRPTSDQQDINDQASSFRGSDSKSLKGSTSAKNIIKNYGRALQNFAVSNMVLVYLTPLLQRERVSLKDFRRFFYSKKKQVRSIAGLRNLLLVLEEDDAQTAAFKKIFQEISIIFIKYFSVNWIFSGKLLNKIAHLKCRFKMLRRIKNPENFTYLKGFL